MKKFNVIVLILSLLPFCQLSVSAQGSAKGNVFGNVAKLDKTVHDFGDIMVSDGPVTASFKVENVGSDAMLIYNVVSSCGCTDVEWTRQPIKPGETGVIKATYKNDEGAYPFDKNLTVYFSGVKQPVILRLKGESHARKQSLKEMYPVKFGSFGMKSVEIKAGNMSQEQQKSGEVSVANLGGKPLKITFKDVSEGLSVKVSPNPIPANSTARMTYTVTADRNHWGMNWYYATPLLDGYSVKASIVPSNVSKPAGAEALVVDPNPLLTNGTNCFGVFAVTKENFLDWTDDQKNKAALPSVDGSNCSIGRVKAGTKLNATFQFKNAGKSVLKIYKVDSQCSKAVPQAFADLPVGGKRELKVSIDTAGMPKGEVSIPLTVFTNSPLRPIMNLFVVGYIY
jgi:Protein of unknown function (DUF1573).